MEVEVKVGAGAEDEAIIEELQCMLEEGSKSMKKQGIVSREAL